MANVVEKLLQGSIDMHIHHGPDIRPRRADALEFARHAQEAGMRAIVLKSHIYPTTPLALTISQVVQNIVIFGSISLNHEVGGLNVHALRASAKMGAKVVWMPTSSAADHIKKRKLTGQGITLITPQGELLPELEQIFEIVKEYRMVLCTGHITAPEALVLVDRACKNGISKVVVTHPLLHTVGTPYSLDDQRRMVDSGAYMEHCFGVTMPSRRLDPMAIVEAIRAVGVEHCIMSTDCGQIYNPAPVEAMRMAIATMLSCGLTEQEMEIMIRKNPSMLLDIDF